MNIWTPESLCDSLNTLPSTAELSPNIDDSRRTHPSAGDEKANALEQTVQSETEIKTGAVDTSRDTKETKVFQLLKCKKKCFRYSNIIS